MQPIDLSNMPKPDYVSPDGSVVLYCADCLTILPQLPVGCVDSFVTDPPYGIDYQSAWRTDRTQWKPKIANDTQPFIWWLHPAARLAADQCACICFCRWDVQEPFRLAMTWAGWTVKAQVVWDRESHGMGDLNGCPAPMHDIIWFSVRGRFMFAGDRPKSVVRSIRLGGDELLHPNQKPEELMVSLVKDYSALGGLVCDPFTGSGSTAVACIKTRRRFVGVESAREHFETSVKRIEQAFADTALFRDVEHAKEVQMDLIPTTTEAGRENK